MKCFNIIQIYYDVIMMSFCLIQKIKSNYSDTSWHEVLIVSACSFWIENMIVIATISFHVVMKCDIYYIIHDDTCTKT